MNEILWDFGLTLRSIITAYLQCIYLTVVYNVLWEK